MRAFVTGSTGLLGNNLVRALEAEGHEVVALARSAEKAQRLLGATGARIVVGDMTDVSSFADHLSGCDAVLHTAAYFREYYAPAGPDGHARALEAINVQGTLTLLEAADRRGVGRFVHVSSAGAVGKKDDGSPGDEATPPSREQIENLYLRSKSEGDAKIAAFVPKHGMAVLEILPGWMWGPGDAGPTSAGQLCLDFLAGKLPGVPPGGTCVVDARDVATAMVRALTRGHHGDRYIVGGAFRTLREVLDAIAEASGRPRLRSDISAWLALLIAHGSELWARVVGGPPTVPLMGVKLLLARYEVTSAKAERDLGVTFRPLAETVRDVVAWYAGQEMFGTGSVRVRPTTAAT